MMSDDEKLEQEEFDAFDVIEIYDDKGGSEKFELLDTVELKEAKYMVITPLNEDEEIEDEIENVYITKIVPNDDSKEILEMITDKDLIDQVFAEFKKQKSTNFEFL